MKPSWMVAEKGGEGPVGGVGGDYVQVAHEHQGLVLGAAAQARDEVAASGRRLDHSRLDTCRRQQVGQVLGGEHLMARRVGRIDADEVSQNLEGASAMLFFQRHRPSPPSVLREVSTSALAKQGRQGCVKGGW